MSEESFYALATITFLFFLSLILGVWGIALPTVVSQFVATSAFVVAPLVFLCWVKKNLMDNEND